MLHNEPNVGDFSNLTIGVLELQGDFAEHTAMLRRCGAGRVVGIRQAVDMANLDAIVFPGGESTAISKLLVEQDMMPDIQSHVTAGLPMFGTCAGCILLAKDIVQRPEQPRIGAMNIKVDRNAYGSQIDSFEAFVSSKCPELSSGDALRVVHIRAPAIIDVADTVEVLASYNDTPILVREGSILACTFHPELTTDTRIHTLFLDMVTKYKSSRASK